MTEYEKSKQDRFEAAKALKSKKGISVDNKITNTTASVLNPIGGKAKLENFWYHYKVHIIVAVIVVVLLLTTLWGKLFKEKFDVSLYVFTNQAIGEYKSDIRASLESVADDFDGNGMVKVKLRVREMNYAEDTAYKKSYDVSGDLGKSEYYLVLTDEKGYDELTKLGLQFTSLTFLSENENESIEYNKFYLKDSNIREMFPDDAVFDDMILCLVSEHVGFNGAIANGSKGSAISEMTGVPIEELVKEKKESHYDKNEQFMIKLIKTS